MQIEITIRYYLLLVRIAMKSLQILNNGEDVEQKNLLTQLARMYIGTVTIENSMEVSHKTGYRTINPAIPLLGIYLEQTVILKDTCTPPHCSPEHYEQQPSHRSNLNVHQQMNG